MSNKTIQLLVSNEQVIFRTRRWDGIDRPEYEDIGVPLARARQIAAELPGLITEAAANAAQTRRLQADDLRRKIDAMEAELARLKAQEAKESSHG